jgi:hypothetical protein
MDQCADGAQDLRRMQPESGRNPAKSSFSSPGVGYLGATVYRLLAKVARPEPCRANAPEHRKSSFRSAINRLHSSSAAQSPAAQTHSDTQNLVGTSQLMVGRVRARRPVK